MKLAYISDLHVDISQRNWELVPQIAEVLRIIHPDVFLICGDVSPELGDIEYALDCFSSLDCHKLFVPGNQDIWVMSERMQEEGHDSYEKYYFYIPEVCRRNGFIPIWMEPIVIDKVGFAGSIGWYDFTLKPEGGDPKTEEIRKSFEDEIWNDLKWACWSDISCITESELGPYRRSDREVSREFINRLDQDIKSLSGSQEVREIVVGLHHPPYSQMIGHLDHPQSDLYFPFLGSEEMGKMLMRHSLVNTVICGHIHEKMDILVGDKRVLCSPVGYLSYQRRKDMSIVEDSLSVIYLFDEEDWLTT